ncbi:T9SS type A sorting domain-containing protein, partial [bacterium]|nr:T9SS type A sorting domain-containing protein [bacterium]
DQNSDPIIGTYGDFIDFDSDGDFDFISGTYGDEGVRFFENTGSPEAHQFSLNTSNFGNVTASASSKVEFCDIDHDGDYDLFLGLYYGSVKFYRNTGTAYVPQFTLEDDNWLSIDVGEDASPEFCDLDGDGDFDLFLGREHGSMGDPKGALHYWENVGTAEAPDFLLVTQMYLTLDVGDRLDHKIIDFDNDGDGDLFFYYYHLGYFENSGTAAEPYFVWRSWNLGGPPSDEATFDLGDLDNDGDMDMIFDWPGDDYEIWENVSATTVPEYQYLSTLETAGAWSQYPALVDIDADLDLDLLTSVFSFSFTNYELWFYQNSGTPEQYSFTFITDEFNHIISDSLRDPCFGDVDNDEDFDLMLYNKFSGGINFFRNDGTIQSPSMTPVHGNILGVAGSDDWRPEFYDLDNDHDLDVTIATHDGGILFFRNTTGDTTAIAPQHVSVVPAILSLTAAPNPANPCVNISFDLSFGQNVVLTVYNSLGKQITTLVDDYHLAGHYNYPWQAASLASGIYFINLQTAAQTLTTRIVILK